jgi:TonB-linked SusC/RagA family outer membrane protein
VTYETQEVNRLPDTQSVYKQGNGGIFTQSHFSWGPRFETSDNIFDNFDKFFQSGSLTTHNLSASGGSEKSTFYISASRTDQDGVVPNSDFDRTTIKIKGKTKILDNLSIGGSATYTNSTSKKPLEGPGVVDGSGGVMIGLINWPLNDDVSDYLNPDGSPRNFGVVDNPFWSALNNTNSDKLNRFIGLYNIDYDPFNWLNISYKIGTDLYNQNVEGLRTPGTTLNGNENGGLFIAERFNQITTSNLTLTLKKELFKDFNTTLFVGNNVEWANTRETTLFGTDFNNPDFVGIRNAASVVPDQFITRKRIVSAFGNLQLDYKGFIYLNLTGRNDWTSTLPPENRSFFYPSVGGSFIFSELLNLKENSKFTFGKVRATWAEVGKDAPPHRLASSLENNIGVGGGFATGFFGNNPTIEPETTTSFEVGTDLRFFNNRLGVDFTYYNISSEDQIVQPRVSQGTGFIFLLINGGTIENKGYELALNASPVRTENFSWDFNINWSTNQSKLIDLPAELPVFVQSDAITVLGLAQGASFVGETFFGLSGSTWERTDDGRLIINPDGYPNIQTNQNLKADREPDWNAGITNSFKYKNLGLSFLIDIRQGSDVFNGTEYELVRAGLSKKTLDRGTNTVFDGVVRNPDGSFSQNTTEVTLDQAYYQNIYANNARNFIEDGSWVRLRYITLNYDLPKSVLDRLRLSTASINLTGKNLLLITDYSGVDPEVDSGGAGVRGTGSTGIDYAGIPSTRGVSLGLNISF